nr:hypothetical protein [Tanacetum cinerariifolium]
MVLMVERNRREHLICRFAGRGNEPDPRDVKIASLKQRIQELEFQQDSPVKEAETESNVWDDGLGDVNPFGERNHLLTKETESKPIIWDIGDEEEEYPFVNKYPSLQEPSMLVEEESCPNYETDNEEESEVIYDTDGNDVDDSPEFELLHPDQGKSLVIQRVLSVTPSKSIDDDSWRRNNIFCTKYNSKDNVCNMINDGGSCENAVSTYMVEKLALKTMDHPEPYQFTWLKKRNAIKVNQCSRSNHYNEGKIDAWDTNVDTTSTRDKRQETVGKNPSWKIQQAVPVEFMAGDC